MGNHTCWSKIGTEEAIESRQENCKGTGNAKDAEIENNAEKIWSNDIEGAEQDAGNWTNI